MTYKYEYGVEIDNDDYNSIIARLKAVYGNSSTAYGQSSLTSGGTLPEAAAEGELITVEDWNKLYEMAERCATHQGTAISVTLPKPVFGKGVTDSDIVQFYSELETAISNIEDSSFNVDPDQLVTTTDGDNSAIQTSSRSLSWSNTIQHVTVVTPGNITPSFDATNWFFNAGSSFIITLFRTGGDNTGANAEWDTLVRNNAVVVIDHSNINVEAGDGPVSVFADSIGSNTYEITRTLINGGNDVQFNIILSNSDSSVITGDFGVFIDESRAVDANAVTIEKPTYSKIDGLDSGGSPILSVVLERINASVPSCTIVSDDSCRASFSAGDWRAHIQGSVTGQKLLLQWQIDDSTQGVSPEAVGVDSKIVTVNSPSMSFAGDAVGETHTMTVIVGFESDSVDDSMDFVADHAASTFFVADIVEPEAPLSCEVSANEVCTMTSNFSITATGGSDVYTYSWGVVDADSVGVTTGSVYTVETSNNSEVTNFIVSCTVDDTAGNGPVTKTFDGSHVRAAPGALEVSIVEMSAGSCSIDEGPCTARSIYTAKVTELAGTATYLWSLSDETTPGASITSDPTLPSITVESTNETLGNNVYTVELTVSDSFSNSRTVDTEYIGIHNRYKTARCTAFDLFAGLHIDGNGGSLYWGYSKPLDTVLAGTLSPTHYEWQEVAYLVDTNQDTGVSHCMLRLKSDDDPTQTFFDQITIASPDETQSITFNTTDNVTNYTHSPELNYAEWHFDDMAGITLGYAYNVDICVVPLLSFEPRMPARYTTVTGELSEEQATFEYNLHTTQWSVLQYAGNPGSSVTGTPTSGTWFNEGVASDYQVKYTYNVISDVAPEIIYNQATDWTTVNSTTSFKCGSVGREICRINLTVSLRQGTDDSTTMSTTFEVWVEAII